MHMISFDTAWRLCHEHQRQLLTEAEQRRLAGRRWRLGRRHSRHPAATPGGSVVAPAQHLPTRQRSVPDGIDDRRAA